MGALNDMGCTKFAIVGQYMAICGKRYKIGPRNGNRKSYALCQTVTFPMTFGDL